MRLAQWFKAAFDLVFPGVCAVCAKLCDTSCPLCEQCLSQLNDLAARPACDRCALPLAYEKAPCPHCQGQGSKPFERVVALCVFEEPIRTLVHHIKYHKKWPLAEYLADRLLESEPAKALLTETQVIVPLPLHPLRQLSRGYNQAALVSRRLAKRCRIPHAEALIRVRNTHTQTHLHSKAKREENLRDAFALDQASAVAGKHMVLVDDVMTTGATLRAAARALRPAKPASISVIALAVADPRGKQFLSV